LQIQALNAYRPQANLVGGDIAHDQDAPQNAAAGVAAGSAANAADRLLEPDSVTEPGDQPDEAQASDPVALSTYTRTGVSVSTGARLSGTISLIA